MRFKSHTNAIEYLKKNLDCKNRDKIIDYIFTSGIHILDFLSLKLYKNDEEYNRAINSIMKDNTHVRYWYFMYKLYPYGDREIVFNSIIADQDLFYLYGLFRYNYDYLTEEEKEILINEGFKCPKDALDILRTIKVSFENRIALLKKIVTDKDVLKDYLNDFNILYSAEEANILINAIKEYHDFDLAKLLCDSRTCFRFDTIKSKELEKLEDLYLLIQLSNIS